jgi:hypothetical protein
MPATASPDYVSLLIQQGPLVVLLGYILIAGARKIWVWGYQLKKAEDRCDRLESLLFKQLNISDKLTTVVGSVEKP